MPIVSLSPELKPKFFDASGIAAAGCKLFSYAAGTSTKQNTYTDSTGATPNTNPVILDALGQASVWLDTSLAYKFVLAPANDTDPPASPIWTTDGVTGPIAQASLQAGASITSAAGGTADALTGAFTPAITVLTNGMMLLVRAASANATTTPTFTPANGVIAAKTIVKGNNLALAAGDIAGAGHWLDLQYDSTLDKWVLLNPATAVATVTSGNDATFADNSVKPAATNWVRGAMSAIATAAGFATSFGSSGYVKFPSWLGSWIIQWVQAQSVSGGRATGSWPITFPNSVMIAAATQAGWAAAPSAYAGIGSPSTSSYDMWTSTGGSGQTLYGIAIGR